MQTFNEFFGKKKKPANKLKDYMKMKTADEFASALSDATADMSLAQIKSLGKKVFGRKVEAMMANAKTESEAIAALKKQFRREAAIRDN